MATTKNLTAVGLFAGIGGIEFGLKSAGLPAGASASNVERLADELTEVVARSMKAKPTEAKPRATMFRS
jgi:hypothetical protein